MTFGRVSAGLRIFVIGLAQKVLIADEVARVAEAAFDKLAAPGLAEAWLGLGAYSIQMSWRRPNARCSALADSRFKPDQSDAANSARFLPRMARRRRAQTP